MRIAKFMSDAGICSRRQAEREILEGYVSINGEVIDTPAIKVTENDVVKYKGKVIKIKSQPRLWLFHKPKGQICSYDDPQGRPTIFQHLKKYINGKVISVGRLDINSEGLILITTNGSLSRKLELPSNNFNRVYRVRFLGQLFEKHIKEIEKGVSYEGVNYQPATIHVFSEKSGNNWAEITITEGKNREIRKIFEKFGLRVNRLIRTAYGPFELNDLPSGQVIEIKGKQLEMLLIDQ